MVKFFLLSVCLNLVLVFPSKTIQAAEELSFVVSEWPPLIMAEDEHGGLLVELVRKTMERAGYDMRISTIPWKRSMEMVKRGEFDGLIGISYTDKRNEDFAYSDPVVQIPGKYLIRRGAEIDWQDLEKLHQMRFAVVRGYSYGDQFDSLDLPMKTEVADDIAGIRMVKDGRVDVFPVNEFIGRYLVAQNFPNEQDEFAFSEEAFIVANIFFVMSRARPDHQEILQKANAALAALKADGTYASILQKYTKNNFLPAQ